MSAVGGLRVDSGRHCICPAAHMLNLRGDLCSSMWASKDQLTQMQRNSEALDDHVPNQAVNPLQK